MFYKADIIGFPNTILNYHSSFSYYTPFSFTVRKKLSMIFLPSQGQTPFVGVIEKVILSSAGTH
jgi:hypothetical protein